MGQWLQLVGARRGEATGGQSAPPRRFERESESHHAWRDRRPVQISAQRRLIKGAPEPGAARLQMHSLRVIVLFRLRQEGFAVAFRAASCDSKDRRSRFEGVFQSRSA